MRKHVKRGNQSIQKWRMDNKEYSDLEIVKLKRVAV